MRLIETLRSASPLIHHITNYVTMNDCANATLAVGASPVMVSSPEEAPQMAALASALVLNMGTPDEACIRAMLSAGRTAKDRGIPIVFDPVGAGATPFRQTLSLKIMEELRPDIVKGNAAELSFLGGLKSAQRGVDSLESAKTEAMFAVASRYACIAVATGEADYICDGVELYMVRGGNPTLGRVCGTGCMSASVLAAMAAGMAVGMGTTSSGSYLRAALSSCLTMKLAGEEAERTVLAALPAAAPSALSAAAPGIAPGLASFRVALMDALSRMDDDALDAAWTRCEATDARA
jgi:hydroxyethylthiazole kinase